MASEVESNLMRPREGTCQLGDYQHIPGHNPDPAKGRNYSIPQDQWVEGIFSGTHGSYWDASGNLYVQDWNVAGRIMKLLRVK